MFKKGTIWWSVLVCIVILVVLLPLLYIGGRALVRGIGSYYAWAFNPKAEEVEVTQTIPDDCVDTDEKEIIVVTSTPIPEVQTNEVCMSAFVDAGASYDVAKDICTTDVPHQNAYRLEAGEYCDSWGTIVYDADRDVEILKNFNAPTVASYSYCYPYSAGIQNAPFFTGAELNPFGEVFDIVFVEN